MASRHHLVTQSIVKMLLGEPRGDWSQNRAAGEGLGRRRCTLLSAVLLLLQQTELHASGAGDARAVPGGRVAQQSPPMQSEGPEQGGRQLGSHCILPGELISLFTAQPRGRSKVSVPVNLRNFIVTLVALGLESLVLLTLQCRCYTRRCSELTLDSRLRIICGSRD